MNRFRRHLLRATILPAALIAPLGFVAAAPAQAAARPPAPCHAGQVVVRAGLPSPGAGQIAVPLLFSAATHTACSLYGYPGVSAVDAHGHKVAAPAQRTGQRPVNVVVAPGLTASATVVTADGAMGGGRCRPQSTGLRVYPPGLHRAQYVPVDLRVCGGEFTVSPVSVAPAQS